MKLILLVLAVLTVEISHAKVTVVSSLCQKEEANGQLRWMKCPKEARGQAQSSREFLDDMNAEDVEQKFCCSGGSGALTDRFCCSLAEKLREIPDFDPASHYDQSVRYRFGHQGHWHFWHYLFFMALTVLFIGFISYIFGCLIFEILYCICCCCSSKKKSTKDYNPPPPASKRRSPYPDNSENMTFVTSRSRYDPPPPNYQSIHNFGGTADLYQNVSSPPPPAYNEAAEAVVHQPLNTHV